MVLTGLPYYMSRLLQQLPILPSHTAAVVSTPSYLPAPQQLTSGKARQPHQKQAWASANGRQPHSQPIQLVCSTVRQYSSDSYQAGFETLWQQQKGFSGAGHNLASSPTQMLCQQRSDPAAGPRTAEVSAIGAAAAPGDVAPSAAAAQVTTTRSTAQRQGQSSASLNDQATSSGSPGKLRRTQWDWECPACSNKFNAGVRLLQHLNKCCPDLMAQQQQQYSIDWLQEGQRQQPGSSTSTPASQLSQPAAAFGGVTSTAVRQLLAAAAELEQALRMRVLQLQYVADPGGGVSPVTATAAATTAAAAGMSKDAQDHTQDRSEADMDDDVEDFASDAGPVQSDVQCSGQAAGHISHSQHHNNGGGAGQHNRNRRKAPRQPLRTPQQIADVLELPMPR